MAQITRLSRLVSGIQRQVDLTTNTLVVSDLMVGGTSGTSLSKTILDRLVSLQNGTELTDRTYHYHDDTTSKYTRANGSKKDIQAGSTDVGSAINDLDDNKLSKTGSIAMTGALNLNSNQINNVTDPTSAQDAATKSYVDSHSGTASSALDGTFVIENTTDPTKEIGFDASGITTGTKRTITMPDANVDLGKVATALQKDGSVTATGALNMGSHKITNVTDPTVAQDAATKNYTDTTFVPLSEVGVANGVAALDSGGKVPYAQLPSALMTFKGAWNASTNTPTLADGVGTTGDVYRASVAGTQNLGSGSQTWAVGDFAIYNGTIWQHSPAADGVSSVNSFSGAVTLTTTDIAEGTNLYFTNARAISAVVVQTITSGDTTHATSSDALFTALAGKQATGNYITALTGDVTASGPGSAAATIANSAVTTAKLAANAADDTIVRLRNNQPLRARNAANSGDVNILHVDASNVTQFNQLPQSSASPSSANDLTNKSYVDNLGTVKRNVVLGDASYTANTTYAVRWAKVANSETAGRVYIADLDATSNDNFHVIGFIQAGGSGQVAGDTVTLTALGDLTLASADTAFGTNDQGLPVYLGAAGAFSVTPSSTANAANVIIGVVDATNKIYVQSRQITGIN